MHAVHTCSIHGQCIMHALSWYLHEVGLHIICCKLTKVTSIMPTNCEQGSLADGFACAVNYSCMHIRDDGCRGHGLLTFLGFCSEGNSSTSSLMSEMVTTSAKGWCCLSVQPLVGRVRVSPALTGIMTSSGRERTRAAKSFLAENDLHSSQIQFCYF